MRWKKASLFFVLLTSFARAEEPLPSYWDLHPLRVGSQAIFIGGANCSDQPGHIQFNKTNFFATLLVPITAQHFLFPRVELNYVGFDWNKNPKFGKTRFPYMQFGLLYFTNALENWQWIARFDYNLQKEYLTHPGLYGLYSGLLWGSYEINPRWHYHVGMLGYGGLEGGTIYPVIGFDFAPDNAWFFQALFPINYSVEYTPIDRWTFAVKVRPLKERLRTGSHEPQPLSIFNYSSIGGELNLRYEIKRRFLIEGYGGLNFGGNFYIKDRYGHKAVYVDFGMAPYLGAKIDIGF